MVAGFSSGLLGSAFCCGVAAGAGWVGAGVGAIGGFAASSLAGDGVLGLALLPSSDFSGPVSFWPYWKTRFKTWSSGVFGGSGGGFCSGGFSAFFSGVGSGGFGAGFGLGFSGGGTIATLTGCSCCSVCCSDLGTPKNKNAPIKACRISDAAKAHRQLRNHSRILPFIAPDVE